MSADTQKKVTECCNPATGEKIGESNLNTVEELISCIQHSKEVQPGWAAVPIRERISIIRNIRTYIVENASGIAEIISRNNGKVRVDALATEVLPAAMAVSYYMKNAKRFLKPEKLSSGSLLIANKRSKIYRKPFGVIGIISPWNYPFGIPFSEVIMALLAGNAVILKTASETQLVGRILEECINSADLPNGIFHYVNLPGRVAGDAFLENGIDKLFFTGSVAVGKYLMKKTSETLTPVVLELGGNDAMIVCRDADLEKAAAGAVWAGFSNTGQSCASVERIYVHESVYDSFLMMLKEKVGALRVGFDDDFNMDMGSMTTQKQVETVQKHIEDAVEKGAKLFIQSQYPKDSKGLFLPATVLTDVNHDMLLMQDETFGPVVGVMKFANIDEALQLANDSYLGLSGSIWSSNRRKAIRIAKQINAGAVMINDHLMSHGLAETPWGGFKESGIGRTHGKLGFDEMTEPQVIVNDIMPFAKRNLWWYPFSERLYIGLLGIIYVLYGKGIRNKSYGLWNLLRIVNRYFSK
ncbi:MAG: aldehyde dehydrogenase family protein [Candidatus Marinimicrobia bacterium]|nr:aldehyde dehydrogenase family protein [Candidatus Neomarinimicrobiota bacterium]